MDNHKIKTWLKYDISNKYKIFDMMIDIEKKILRYLDNNNLKLNIPRDIFFMRIIDFIFRNSKLYA